MLRAVSYNIHSGRDLFWRKRLEQMVQALREIQPDAIALQEVHQNPKYGYQADYIAEQLDYQVVFAPSIALAGGYYGNAFLTRLPIHDTKVISLPAKREKRTLLDVSVSWEGRDISIWNTHCSLNKASRFYQLQRIMDLTSQQLDLPRLVLGDFNASSISFSPYYIDCAVAHGKENLHTLPAFRKRLDYIFASRHWDVCRYDLYPIAWSDHLPVIVDLRLHDA
ncbi:endonuclease/exonuclease/phosphatase family protein [Brevibacillus nitrificans]|uniref:endonuclease/exonuclease/phosphatase family protein n=1 Tax=Brevibacillus nitrificans TaxID=651560 RepID=UPI002856775D|nr:endonuclease/exonuclease/phosphatase family protein [Brevibacillus nitrificans]MDR7318816.1 endonuclease/exonuclease/phosphatase family metal-dependent hydrolase [Brevibacillus nitrificans]